MTAPEGLYGRCGSCGEPHMCDPVKRRTVPPAFRIELLGRVKDGTADSVRFALINQETGQPVGFKELPFSWLRDVAFGGVAEIIIREGDVA